MEKAGAQALIIARDLDTYIDSREFHFSESNYDGSGLSIGIPTLIVSEEAGKKLTKLMEWATNFEDNVVLKAEIDISSPTMQIISYSLYYGSIVDLSFGLIAELYNYSHALKGNAFFMPRILTFECDGCPDEVKK